MAATTASARPDVEAALLDAVPRRLLVGGAWCEAADGRELEVLDPATGEVLATVADATAHDGLDALAAADAAFPAYRALAPRARARLLHAAADALVASEERFALLITLEMGKPLAESRGEVAYAADFLRAYAERACDVGGRTLPAPDGGGQLQTRREPVGPCVLLTPWNFPLAMATRKLAPALAVGCTAVVKPAPQTPLCALALGELLEQVGVPAGVVNVVPTSRAEAVVGALLADPRARKLSFTGSTRVGQALIRQSADQVLRTSMELGGNAPFLVFADADLDAAVEHVLTAKMRNGGEACTAANRVLVERPVAAELCRRVADRMAGLVVGPGTAPGVDVGPLIDEAQLGRVDALVRDALDRGARLVCGGERVEGPGAFYAPTVLDEVPADARVLHEEAFGPVAPFVAFDSEQQAVALANATPYGLVAYVCTQDLGRAGRVVDALRCGMVGVNTGVVSSAHAPFGGVGHSGYGREGGPEGLDEYLQTKYVALRDVAVAA